MEDNKTGIIYVISAPSGAGKTSLVKALLQQLSMVSVCVSHTTRAPRDGEIDGTEYHFITQDEFQSLIHNNKLIEYANVFGNFYGTSLSEIDRITATGKDVILEIDWQGARQVKDLYSKHTNSIFILPPSLQALENRLNTRGKDSIDVIKHRMETAQDEISHCDEYKYIIVNNQFEDALNDLISIFRIERLKINQLSQIDALVAALLK